MRTSTGLAPHLPRTHGNKSTLLLRAKSPPVPTQATAVAGPSRPPTHVLETHNSVPETDGALAHSSKFNAPRAPPTWRQPPQTFGRRHTNGHGSVGAYNTAPTSPTTRRPPGPVRGGDRAAQPAGLHPPPAGPPTHPRPEPVHRPSDQTWGCTTQWTAPTSNGPLSLVAQADPTATTIRPRLCQAGLRLLPGNVRRCVLGAPVAPVAPRLAF